MGLGALVAFFSLMTSNAQADIRGVSLVCHNEDAAFSIQCIPLFNRVNFKLVSAGVHWDTSTIQHRTEAFCDIDLEDPFLLRAVVREDAYAIGVEIARTESHAYDPTLPDWAQGHGADASKTALVVDAKMAGYKKYPSASVDVDHETPIGKILFFDPERDCVLDVSE